MYSFRRFRDENCPDAPAAALIPDLLEFYTQAIGTSSASQPVTIIDMGSTALSVSNATVTGDFSIQNNCTTVAAAGATCTIAVIFTPTALGPRNGVLTITDNSAGSPRTVQLAGMGGGPMAVPTPSSLSFPAQAVGTTSPAQQTTLANSGQFNLQINRIQTSGNFSQTNTCGASVTLGLSCTISVVYSPTRP